MELISTEIIEDTKFSKRILLINTLFTWAKMERIKMGRKKKSLEPNITTASVGRPWDYSAEETMLFMEKKEWFTGDIKCTKDRAIAKSNGSQSVGWDLFRDLQGFMIQNSTKIQLWSINDTILGLRSPQQGELYRRVAALGRLKTSGKRIILGLDS